MNQAEIKEFLESFQDKRDRTIVIVDWGNVEKWDVNLGWKVGIQELAKLVKHFAYGKEHLRRFYFGEDYGPNEKATTLRTRSGGTLLRAKMNRFQVVSKRVKYIHDSERASGFQPKCNLDVEMSVDLIRAVNEYDQAVIFSGDGDLVYAMRFLHDKYGKDFVVFGARGHTGREIQDAPKEGVVQRILYADDFEYRLNMHRSMGR